LKVSSQELKFDFVVNVHNFFVPSFIWKPKTKIKSNYAGKSKISSIVKLSGKKESWVMKMEKAKVKQSGNGR
jgi:predicted nucleotidyltransferase